MADTVDFKYHLFVSYTRTPDALLAREIERFLESFHLTPVGPEKAGLLRQLQVCIDCHDFSIPPEETAEGRRGRPRRVLQVVIEHLARSRELLVLCSAHAARSDWVDQEIRWFLERYGARAIRLALTDGEAPWAEPESFFPKPVIEQGLHNGIAYDLRGYDERRARSWKQVPDFQREMVRLAADLCGTSAGELYPSWLEAELQRVTAQSLSMASTARFETLAGDPARALFKAYDAHELHPSDSTEVALREAYKVAVLHHHNRRETARITGSGPGYLAAHWKQGEVFVKTSADGRYRLLVTQRGRDGADPPGDVYLISNETLRAVKLEPSEGERGRVEDVAFDRQSRHVFVTRYFDLSVYSIDGRRIGGYAFSRHTKSPVHLVDGYLVGCYAIGAETKGGVWLVDPQQAHATIELQREWHGDVALFIDIAANGRCAALVFRSTRAALVSITENGTASVRVISPENVLFAAFADGKDDLLVTAGEDGVVRLWEVGDNEIRESSHTAPLPAAVDWVSLSEDGRRLAAVAADHRVYVIDRERGDLITTLDLADTVDWAAARTVAPPPSHEVRPAPADELGPAVPFDSATLAVRDVTVIDGVPWAFTEEREEGELLSKNSAYLVSGGQARLFAARLSAVSKHHDVLWFSESWAGGTPYWITDNSVRRLLSAESKPQCIFAQGSVVWIGTARGAYRHEGAETRLETPDDLFVEGIREIGGRLWLRTKQGCFVIEHDRLVRVTDWFLQAREIKEAGGRTWILGEDSAYRVNGYFTTRLPNRGAKVSDVLEAGGCAWIVEKDRLHKVDVDRLRTVTGFVSRVDALALVGRSFWATTDTGDYLHSVGPAYTFSLDAPEPTPLDLHNARLHRVAGETFLSHGPEDARVLAHIGDEGLRGLDLPATSPWPVVEVGGEVWLLTTSGAYRWTEDGPSRIPSPAVPVTAVSNVDGRAWLLTSSGAVRIEEDGRYTFFRTGKHSPRGVVNVENETWILTGPTWSSAGPAYRVSGRRAFPHAPSGAGVTAIVEIDRTVWLLTQNGVRAGPPVRFRPRRATRQYTSSSEALTENSLR
jgi:antiphage defense system Thoeris ThsB-like protein